MTRNRRRLLLQGMAAGTAGGLSGLIQQVLAAEAAQAGSGIRRLQGSVRVNGVVARVGTPVRPGDEIETGPEAEVTYVIGDDAFLQRGGTRTIFGAEAAATFMRVLTGGILSVFGRRETRRTLVLPTATIGIRGTGCYIETEPRRSYFCLCYGEVDVEPQNGQPLSYETRHHENPLWIGDGATTRAPVINHTDAELTMLEALVDREPPFAQTGGPVY